MSVFILLGYARECSINNTTYAFVVMLNFYEYRLLLLNLIGSLRIDSGDFNSDTPLYFCLFLIRFNVVYILNT